MGRFSRIKMIFLAIIVSHFSGYPQCTPEIYPNGTFETGSSRYQAACERSSDDGVYTCSFTVTAASDEIRVLKDFSLFENGVLLFTLAEVPGSEVEISNSGYCVFHNFGSHFQGKHTIHFYNKTGQKLVSFLYESAAVFGFSQRGNLYGVGSRDKFEVVNIAHGVSTKYPPCIEFAFSANEENVAIADDKKITIFADGKKIREIANEMPFLRKTAISKDNERVAVIDKRRLKVYSTVSGTLSSSDELEGDLSYRDILFSDDRIWTGIQLRNRTESRGIIRSYSYTGKVINEELGPAIRLEQWRTTRNLSSSGTGSGYPKVQWPFKPVDKSHDIYNNWEGLNTATDGDVGGCYLHQGVDMEVAVNEPVYAVVKGTVKCVLTTGGDAYWRVGVAEQQTTEQSDGWLYAHLIQSSILVAPGDIIEQGEQIGNIIFWYEDWGHLHFARISDHGLTWLYTDDEWGIVYNPLLSLTPNTDTKAPVFQNVTASSKFAFCKNIGTGYLEPNKLSGDIDIIVKIIDEMDSSTWSQPAFALYYWVKSVDNNKIVVPRTLSQIANHAYSFYDAAKYKPFAQVMYKFDATTCVPGGWFNRKRPYHHALTNTNGDSLIIYDEKDSCLHTDKYNDGRYRVYAEAFDSKGNSTVDSQDVVFNNGVTGLTDNSNNKSPDFSLIVSNKLIAFSISENSNVAIEVYSLYGQRIAEIHQGYFTKGTHSVSFNNFVKSHANGMYLLKVKTIEGILSRKIPIYN